MLNKLKEIKRILKEHDVRDPRACIQSIENIAFQKNPEKKVKPALRVDVIDDGEGVMEVKMCGVEEDVLPRHVGAAMKMLSAYALKRAETVATKPECNPTLRKLFAQFAEEEARNNKKEAN